MSPSTILAGVVLTFFAASSAGAGGEEKALLAEFRRADAQVYEALESVPIRAWGRQETLRPFNDLRSRLRHPSGGAEARRRLVASLSSRLAGIHERFCRTLRVAPAVTLAFGPTGAVKAQPSPCELTAHVDVPAAILLRIQPAGGVGGKLTVRGVEAEGLKIGGIELPLLRHFAQYAAVPLTASGPPGRREIALKLTAGGRASSIPLAVTVAASGRLTGTIVRKGGQGRLAAKLYVEDAAGRLHVAAGETNWRTQSWYAPWQPRFSYVDGRFSMPLPPGEYRLTALKGYQWPAAERSVEVAPGKTTDCPIELEPIRDTEADGWYCADMHIHRRGGTPLVMLRAEDVNVAANTLYSSRRSIPMPFDKRQSDATHLSTSDQEIEHWIFGNVFFFDIPRTAVDPPGGKPEMTPMFHYDEQAHRMGGITLRWLRGRPFSPKWHGQGQPEIAVSAALGHMDVWSVLENSMQNLLDEPRRKWTGRGWGGRLYENTYRTWYGLLNCGLRVAAGAGTSYGRLSRLGFNRVYGRVRGPLTNASWADALKRGRGFVTNGPLLLLRAGPAGGRCETLPGDGIALAGPGKVALAVELASRHPVRLVEVLRNGQVVARRPVGDLPAGGMTWRTDVEVPGPCWLAARCFGEHRPRYVHAAAHNQFAHTNPLVVTVAGRRPTSPGDAARFVREIDALIEFAPRLPSEDLRGRALAAYRKARAYYAAQLAGER